MAVRTWEGDETALWSTAGNWDTGVPEDGDSVVMDNAANCSLDADQIDIELAGFDMSGYTGTFAMADNDLDVDGNCVLDGTITADEGAVIYVSGQFTKTTGMTALPSTLTIEHDVTDFMATRGLLTNSVTGGNLIINGTFTSAPQDAGYWDNFTMTAGSFVPSNFEQSFAGNISYGGGSFSSTSIWHMTGTGKTISWTSGTAIWKLHIASGVSITSSNYIRVARFHCEGTLTGSDYLHIYYITANDFWEAGGGTVSINDVYLQTDATVSNTDDIVIVNKDFRLLGTKTGAYTLTLSGDLNLGTGDFKCDASNADVDLILNGDLTCTDLILGHDPARTTAIDLVNGSHTVHNDIKRKNADPGTLSLDVGGSVITLGNEFDGTSITVTGEALGSAHAEIHGGSVANVVMPADDATLDATDSDDGQGCSNVWFSGMSGGHSVVGVCGMVGSGKVSA